LEVDGGSRRIVYTQTPLCERLIVHTPRREAQPSGRECAAPELVKIGRCCPHNSSRASLPRLGPLVASSNSSWDQGDVYIEDAVTWLNETFESMRTLTEWFFEHCFAQLEPIEHAVICGIYNARLYERFVAPTETLSSDDGRCLSRGWFETEPGCECPKRTTCGAYSRPVPDEERNSHYGVKK
jgi:hypothetical protein